MNGDKNSRLSDIVLRISGQIIDSNGKNHQRDRLN